MRSRFLPIVVLAALLCAPAAAAVPDRERTALMALYNSTDGANWTTKDGWGGAAGTECDWYGVYCDNARTTVVALILSYNNLNGPFPVSVTDLSSLEELNLNESNLTGQIPAQISQLTKLKSLILYYNSLSGSIPPSIGSMTSLTELDLDTNALTGAIPPELGKLTNLQLLSLYTNKLTGPIPRELAQAVSLTRLNVEYNNLSGPLPPELGTMSQLTLLSINNNAFSGALPPEIGNLRNLTTLDVSSNQFSGPIPSQLGNLTHLDQLWLGGNQFTGDVPQSLFGLTSLTALGLDHNQLTGQIAGFGRLTALTDLEIEANQFSGAIPSAIMSLTSLVYLNLSENQLSGPIPDFDRLTALVWLDLGRNALTGPVPSSFGRMTQLQDLDLRGNQLTGTIPPELGSMTALRSLDLASNQLTGTIPASLRALTQLQTFSAGENQLTGSVPDWFSGMPQIDTVSLASNQLTGTIPANISASTTLFDLDLSGNQLTGPIPSDIGRLQNLQYLFLDENDLSGPLPASLWDLQQLVYLALSSNHFTGTLSPSVGGLANIEFLAINDNELTGSIPATIGSLSKAYYIGLYANRFGGTIPRELGQLKALQYLDLSGNNLRAPIPPELEGMTALLDGRSDFGYNALFTTDATLRDFINRVQYGNDYESTQTVPPSGVRVTQTTDRSATVEWSAIAYIYDEGGYQVRASLTSGGPFVAIATTSWKEATSIVVRGLQPSTNYFFTVAAVTHPHDFQRNLIVSDLSAPVSAATTVRTLAPADVVVTDWPKGLIQIDGIQQNQDSFTLTNFGDVATTISLEYDLDNQFFSLSQPSVTLGPGASQTIQITSSAQPAGYRYGYISPHGDGVGSDVYLTVTLLSVVRAGGLAVAEALTSRVEIAGVAGADSVGTVTFRNRGTARLNGILVADVPWIAPPADPIAIDPGSSQLVRFTVVRSRRPAGAGDGALTGTLSLIYVGELPSGDSTRRIEDTTPPSISITKVTVVDVTKPDVGPGNAQQLAAGEIAYFIAGLKSSNSGSSGLASDLHMVNAFGAKPLTDVRLYYTSAAQQAVATLTPLLSNQAVTLANIASNVYGAGNQTGSLQVRSVNWQNLMLNASLLRLGGAAGTFISDMPVFRSDRALRANDKLYLTGVSQAQNVKATLVIEEIAGVDADLSVGFLDSNGSTAQDRPVHVPAFATMEIGDVPANTATVVVTNSSPAASSAVLAYVRMSDEGSGDTWSVVDWSRLYQYSRSAAVRLPLVQASGGGGKRRAVTHSDSTGTPRFTTSVSLYNAATTEARARVSTREIVVPGSQTVTIDDVAAFAGISTAQSIVIEPTHGELAITSRTSASSAAGGSLGTAVPVVSSQSGLRLGQGQIFSGLEDSSAYRTDYGFAETTGAPATIRATILLSDSRSAFTTVVSRDFALTANGFVFTSDLVRSIVGSARNKYGDLHDLQLQLEVSEGGGAILPFVVVTDNVTGDASLRLQ